MKKRKLIDRLFTHLGYQRIPITPPAFKVEAVSITLLRAQHRIHKSRLINHVDAPEFADLLKKHTLNKLKNEILDAVAQHIQYSCTESRDGSEIIIEAGLHVSVMKSNNSNCILNDDLKIWIA